LSLSLITTFHLSAHQNFLSLHYSYDASGFIRGDKAAPARKGAMFMIAAAAVVGGVIAALVVKKRKVETRDHPLKGALNRRIQLFSNLASHHEEAARPPRRYDEEQFYNADYVLPEDGGAKA